MKTSLGKEIVPIECLSMHGFNQLCDALGTEQCQLGIKGGGEELWSWFISDRAEAMEHLFGQLYKNQIIFNRGNDERELMLNEDF